MLRIAEIHRNGSDKRETGTRCKKYQQSLDDINIQKHRGISKHVITVMISCKMFISTELFGKVQTAPSTGKNFLEETKREYRSDWCHLSRTFGGFKDVLTFTHVVIY